jgi:MFS transporter, DHA1 family, multidrug resistance protein
MDRAYSPDRSEKAGRQNLAAITLTQFGSAFSLNFVNIFLPFYIFRVSPYSQRETLLWVGAIVGLTTVFTALASPLWGSLTHRYSPKMLYMRGMLTHSLMFFFMAFTTNLHLLLVLRIIQGVFGGVSTAGIILISSGSKKEDQASNMGMFQAALTLGPLLGPPLGTFAAAFLGYRNGFLAGAAFLFAAFIFAQIYVIDMPPLPKPVKATGKHGLDRRIMIAWIVCFVAQIQLSFLPSVLPNVFKEFRMDESTALKFAGLVVMAYTASAALGQFVWTRLSRRLGVARMITFLLVMGLTFQAALALTHGIIDFTVVRMIQTGFAAGAIPLIISMFLDNPSGGTVGFLNASRFTGMAVGPMLATAVVAFSSLGNLYLLISAITVLASLCFRYSFSANTVSKEQ